MMASGIKNMAFAGAVGAATVARFSAPKPGSRTRRRGYLAGQSPCRPTVVGREQALAAGTEGLCLTDHRQLKI